EITRKDQLLPYYVMNVAKNIPELSGIFIAAIFSAPLSYQRNKSLNGPVLAMFTLGVPFPKANAI
ncbi:hypothetical protein BDFB_014907, partial [Asbolus verrucosus]